MSDLSYDEAVRLSREKARKNKTAATTIKSFFSDEEKELIRVAARAGKEKITINGHHLLLRYSEDRHSRKLVSYSGLWGTAEPSGQLYVDPVRSF